MGFLRLSFPISNITGELNNDNGLSLSSVLCPLSHSAPWNNVMQEKSTMLDC